MDLHAVKLTTRAAQTPLTMLLEYIREIWTSDPERAIPDSIHQMLGLNTQIWAEPETQKAAPKGGFHRKRDTNDELSRFGDDLLSHVLRRSTIGATALNGRVRDGTGCFACAMITKPKKLIVFPNQAYVLVCMLSIDCSKHGFYWIKSSLSDN